MIGTVPTALGRARGLVGPALRRRVDRLSPPLRRVCGYHFGFTDEAGRPAHGDGGKAVRPALALLSAEGAGSSAEVALPGAVAVELVHNFSLLHDDVMDRDRERRHRATAWAVFGEGPAILAGDALLVLAHHVLLEDATPARVAASRRLADATARMIEGQADDVALQAGGMVSLAECRAMMAGKTGALLSCAASIGALLAEAPAPAVSALADFGLHLGLAFQAIDDVLGIWGDPEVTGKPVAGDLRERKRSYPVVAALTSGGPEADRLLALLGHGEPSGDALAEAVSLVERLGGRSQARVLAEREMQLCLDALDRAGLHEPARTELEDVARFVTARDF
jgi:geranylgeranyl diphosphate synthase, type I